MGLSRLSGSSLSLAQLVLFKGRKLNHPGFSVASETVVRKKLLPLL